MKAFKKIGLLLAALMIFAGSADAKIVSFGIKAGLNINKLSFSQSAVKDLTTPSNSTGWTAGAMAEFNVPLIGLAADVSVMYTRMNNGAQYYFKENGNQLDAINAAEAGKNFIELPINLKYKFQIPAISRILSPYIFTGPSFAFKLGKQTWDDIKTKKCQVAWNVGLGLQLVNHLQIGASYGFGINNIAEKVFPVQTQELKVKNNYWTVTAAWLF